MTIDDRAVGISQLTLAELRADESGNMVEQLAQLISEAFREPPWNEHFSASRIHFGLGVELMRRGALLYIAKQFGTGHILGYLLGKEVFSNSNDDREQTLFEISGTKDLDVLFESGKRIFYVTGLAVRSEFKRGGLAERLSLALNEELKAQGFDYRLGRTDNSALAMRALYGKLGFRELPTVDGNYPNRTYWLLAL